MSNITCKCLPIVNLANGFDQQLEVLYLIQCECMPSHFSHIQLCNLTDYTLPGSSGHVILHTRILEWVAGPSSRGLNLPLLPLTSTDRQVFTTRATWETQQLIQTFKILTIWSHTLTLCHPQNTQTCEVVSPLNRLFTEILLFSYKWNSSFKHFQC